MDIEEKIKDFPTSSGVYIMYDAAGKIIYIGKGRNLRERVKNYFRKSGDSRHHISFLVKKIADIEIILTDTEKEALLLENSLIKQHKPRYNLMLKDDKTYFSIRIDLKERFPRFNIVRKRPNDKAKYFGPYSSGTAAKEVLKQINRLFPLRHYPLQNCLSRKRPCLYHQIGECSAPCHGLISEEKYMTLVNSAILFLEGRGRELVKDFKEKMKLASEDMRYEDAAKYRDLLKSIEVTVEKQKIVTDAGNADFIWFSRDFDKIVFSILYIRNGVMTGGKNYLFTSELDDSEVTTSFIERYYSETDDIPDEIAIGYKTEDISTLEELLKEKKGKKVVISTPSRGEKVKLLKMAEKNAMQALTEAAAKDKKCSDILNELKEKLNLTRLPHLIECYDISNIQGSFSVGSKVAFFDAKPDKSRYRRYKIETVEQQNDYAMLKEVFSRRFKPENIEKSGMPDLVVVDGGIGQLNATAAIIEELHLSESFALVSLAKSRVIDKDYSASLSRSDERVFILGRKNPLHLKQNSQALLLLAAIRDEAHRFAITYHRNLRSRDSFSSILDQINGISQKRRDALLKHFGSVENLRNADINDIENVAGISKELAEKIFNFFREMGN